MPGYAPYSANASIIFTCNTTRNINNCVVYNAYSNSVSCVACAIGFTVNNAGNCIGCPALTASCTSLPTCPSGQYWNTTNCDSCPSNAATCV
jgi:hypothetical protein